MALWKSIMKRALPKNDYKRVVIKNCYETNITQENKTGETIIIIFNSYQKMVRTVSNNHIRQNVSTIIKSPLAFRTSSYVSIATIHVPPTSFLFRYATSIIKCSFFFLFCPLFHLLHFVFNPLFMSFSIIMRISMCKEKAKKTLRGQSLKEAKLDSKWEITPNKWN